MDVISVDVISVDVDIQTANISWSTPHPPPASVSEMIEDVNQTYMLAVISSNTQPQILVPSQVLSRMLPSQPDILNIESSIEYSLEKSSDSSIILNVSFMVSCCDIVRYKKLRGCMSYCLRVSLILIIIIIN